MYKRDEDSGNRNMADVALEAELERGIVADPRWQGRAEGESRGPAIHKGKVELHVADVLRDVGGLRLEATAAVECYGSAD
jgi:hypothetical protein